MIVELSICNRKVAQNACLFSFNSWVHRPAYVILCDKVFLHVWRSLTAIKRRNLLPVAKHKSWWARYTMSSSAWFAHGRAMRCSVHKYRQGRHNHISRQGCLSQLCGAFDVQAARQVLWPPKPELEQPDKVEAVCLRAHWWWCTDGSAVRCQYS